MKKIKFVLASLFLLVFIQMFAASQVKFSVGPELGVTIPVGDYSGTTIDYYNGTAYGLSPGINFGVVFKAALPVISFRVAANFSSLKNTGNSEPGQGSVTVKHHLFMLSAGPEFVINLPGSPVKPYLGADLLFTSFSGETSFQGVARVPSGPFEMSSASRIGLGVGGGVEFSIGKKYLLDLGFRYNIHNLFSKSFSGGDDRIFSYTSLNDDADPLYPEDISKHPIGSSRSISTLQVNLVFLFGL
jgi:opacity protein-like surface antigen